MTDNGQTPAPCATCGGVPVGGLTANTGRDERFGSEVGGLVPLGLGKSDDLRRCRGCGALFEWHDVPQAYGSGNLDEETLDRLAPELSALYERFIAGDFEWAEASQLVRSGFTQIAPSLFIPLLSRLPAAQFEFVLPDLVERLVDWDAADHQHTGSLSSILSGFSRGRPERARLILGLLRAARKPLGPWSKMLVQLTSDE